MAKNSFIGERLHAVGVRMRVVGSGNLRTTLYSLDEVNSSTLANIAMQATTNREPTILANFTEQRMQVEVKTTEMDETFRIGKIIIFVKPVAEDYPI